MRASVAERIENTVGLSGIDSFTDVVPLTLDELQGLLGQIADDDAFDMIYDSPEANVWRHFRQSRANTFAVRFFAEHCERELFAFTQGIVCCPLHQVYDWEKVGKRKLVDFMRHRWGVHF